MSRALKQTSELLELSKLFCFSAINLRQPSFPTFGLKDKLHERCCILGQTKTASAMIIWCYPLSVGGARLPSFPFLICFSGQGTDTIMGLSFGSNCSFKTMDQLSSSSTFHVQILMIQNPPKVLSVFFQDRLREVTGSNWGQQKIINVPPFRVEVDSGGE